MNRTESKHAQYRKRCETMPFHMYNIVKRSEARKKGLPYNLDSTYLESLWTGVCPVLGLSLNVPMKDAKGRGSLHTAHLDRIDPNKGYVVGNVAWLSGRANRIKYDATLEELRSLVAWMEATN